MDDCLSYDAVGLGALVRNGDVKPFGADGTLLRVAARLEQARPRTDRRPAL